MSAVQAPSNESISMYDMIVKCMFDSQNNINTLIQMQNQQMIYINTLLKSLRIDGTIPTPPATIPTAQSLPNEEQNKQQQADKTSNPKPITKKNKDISGKTRQNKQKV